MIGRVPETAAITRAGNREVLDLVREDRVHRRVYTDPALFDAEMVHVFAGTWVYLLHESELPKPNDFKTGHLGRRPVILTRDGDGRIHALFNRCRHRGATVCRVESGNTRRFTCPYHGWTYHNDGELVGVPWPSGYGPDFQRSAFPLAAVPRVESYRGFVFGTLNLEAPALADHLGPARELMDQWIDRSPTGEVFVRSGANRMVYNGNWKLAYDNAADGYHVGFSHRSLLAMAQRFGEEKDMIYSTRDPDSSAMYVRYLGNGHTFGDQRPSYAGRGPGGYWRQQRPQPGREVYERRIRSCHGDDADRLLDLAVGSQMNLNIFPNLLLLGNQIQVIEPIAVNRTQLTWHWTTIGGVPDEVNTLRMRTQEDFPSFGEVDDQANFEECQRGLSIPEVEWVLINRGLGLEGRHTADERGVVTAPKTDELPQRGYLSEWRRLMSSDVTLVAG
jgi:phenylpropionate dioxygenase-like ring-hydroxylating dioxygenase large terminal subunit